MLSGIAGSPQIERFRKARIQRNRTIQTLNGIRMTIGITVFQPQHAPDLRPVASDQRSRKS